MGRPGTSEPRDRQLNISLTERELASIARRAEALGMRPVHFGRALLLDEQRRLARAEPQDNTGKLIHTQLIRLGQNLNQLLRHIYRTGETLPPDLEPLLRDIRQLIARMPS